MEQDKPSFKPRLQFLFIFIMVIPYVCYSQSNITLKAGISISKFQRNLITNTKPYNSKINNSYGPVIGIEYQHFISKPLSFYGGVFINTKGGKSNFFFDENFWIAYVQFPIGVSFQPKSISKRFAYSFSSAFAPSFDIGTSIGMPKNNNLSLPRHRYHDMDIWLGASVYRNRWGINFQYCYGLKTISKFENYYSLKNRSFNIMIAYKLKKMQ